MVSVAGGTLKALGSEKISAPGGGVRLREPRVALDAMSSFAVKDVWLVITILVADIPSPRLICVVPCKKCVSAPVMVTGMPFRPCGPLEGMTEIKEGGVPGLTTTSM